MTTCPKCDSPNFDDARCGACGYLGPANPAQSQAGQSGGGASAGPRVDWEPMEWDPADDAAFDGVGPDGTQAPDPDDVPFMADSDALLDDAAAFPEPTPRGRRRGANPLALAAATSAFVPLEKSSLEAPTPPPIDLPDDHPLLNDPSVATYRPLTAADVAPEATPAPRPKRADTPPPPRAPIMTPRERPARREPEATAAKASPTPTRVEPRPEAPQPKTPRPKTPWPKTAGPTAPVSAPTPSPRAETSAPAGPITRPDVPSRRAADKEPRPALHVGSSTRDRYRGTLRSRYDTRTRQTRRRSIGQWLFGAFGVAVLLVVLSDLGLAWSRYQEFRSTVEADFASELARATPAPLPTVREAIQTRCAAAGVTCWGIQVDQTPSAGIPVYRFQFLAKAPGWLFASHDGPVSGEVPVPKASPPQVTDPARAPVIPATPPLGEPPQGEPPQGEQLQ